MDWQAEGLLDGLETDEERDGRRELLDRLHAEGCSTEELRRAVEEDRIALLPVEKLLLRGRLHTMADAIDKSGMSEEYIRADRRAIGLPEPQPDELLYNDDSLRSFQGLKFMLDAGVTEAQLLELTRMVGDASGQRSDAVVG
jgi:hypothetical protein